jgi:hypothetical protein
MSAYVELHIKGGGCAIVDASMIGAVMAKGHDAWKVGSPDAPTLIVLKSGETLEIVGASPGGVIGRVVTARQAVPGIPVPLQHPVEGAGEAGPDPALRGAISVPEGAG